jgi:uncharacterized protein YjiS (DUF1127 family)
MTAPQQFEFNLTIQRLIWALEISHRLLCCSATYTEGDMIIANVVGLLRAWRRYNASLRELNQLGDRELSDIGISRSDIPRIAWENAHR